MSRKSTWLALTIQEYGDNTETWGSVDTENLQIIDRELGRVRKAVSDAAGSKSSLAERLAEACDQDGTPKSSPEIVDARNIFTSLSDRLQSRGNDWVANAVNVAPAGNGYLKIDTTTSGTFLTKFGTSSASVLVDIQGIEYMLDVDTLVDSPQALRRGTTNYIYAEPGSAEYALVGVGTDNTEVSGRVYFAEVGPELAEITFYALKRRYDSGWRTINVGDIKRVSHYLGYAPTSIKVLVSGESTATGIAQADPALLQTTFTTMEATVYSAGSELFWNVAMSEPTAITSGKYRLILSY